MRYAWSIEDANYPPRRRRPIGPPYYLRQEAQDRVRSSFHYRRVRRVRIDATERVWFRGRLLPIGQIAPQ